MIIIDRYAYTNKLTDSNPYYKFLLVAIALVIATVTKNPYVNLIIFTIMFLLTTKLAGIPIDKYLKILFIPISFLILTLIPILISIQKADLFLWSIKIFDNYIGVTRSSIDEAILLATRVFAAMASTFFLGLTTPLNKIIKVLKTLHLPDFIIELIVLIYRFIFVFIEGAREIYLGQEMKFAYTNFRNSINSASLLVRSLFLKVILDYKDMVVVLECKLYDGEFRTGD